MAPEQRAAAGVQRGLIGCCCPALLLLLPALPGRLLFPVLTREAHALRPFPRQAEGREGSVVFLSSFLRLTGLLTGSDSPDGNPRWLSRPLLLQGPRPWLICLCPDRGKEGEREGKEKPQTSFESQFVGRAWSWSARRRLGDSGILKTLGSRGTAEACPRPLVLTLLVLAPDPAPAAPGLGVSPEVAATQAGRCDCKPVSSRVSSGADSWEAADAFGAPQRRPHLPRRIARVESSPRAGTSSTSLREEDSCTSIFHPFQAWKPTSS